MKKKICFIINPAAGVYRKDTIFDLIHKHIDKSLYEYSLHLTAGTGHATALAQQAVQQHTDIVVAVGGDGTINEVGQGLVGTQTSLAILPTGSGNGIARHLRIPLNPLKALQLMLHATTVRMDTFYLNDHLCIGMAGIGFDAYVALKFAEEGKRGALPYFRISAREFARFPFQNYHLVVDGKPLKTLAFLIGIANINQYGCNALIAPQASITDGYLNLSILHPFPSYLVPYLVFCLFRGTLDRTSYLQIIKCKEVVIQQHPILTLIDGEAVLFKDQVHIRISPASLNLLVP